MTEENEIEPVADPPADDGGISTDDLRTLIGEVLDEKLSGLNLLDDLKSWFNENKSTVDEEGLLSKIGAMIDDKSKGKTPDPKNDGPKERNPKLRIF